MMKTMSLKSTMSYAESCQKKSRPDTKSKEMKPVVNHGYGKGATASSMPLGKRTSKPE